MIIYCILWPQLVKSLVILTHFFETKMCDAIIINYWLLLHNYSTGKSGSQIIELTYWYHSCSIEGHLFESRQLEDIKKQETEHLCLNAKLKTIFKWTKSTEKLLGGVLFIELICKLCVTLTEKYYSTTDRYICPIFLQTLCCVKKLRTPPESRHCMEL